MTRNERIIELVKGGASRAEAAKQMGVSLGVVCGVCWRAGMNLADRVGKYSGRARTPEGEARRIAALKAKFKDPAWRDKFSRACSRAQRERFAKLREARA